MCDWNSLLNSSIDVLLISLTLTVWFLLLVQSYLNHPYLPHYFGNVFLIDASFRNIFEKSSLRLNTRTLLEKKLKLYIFSFQVILRYCRTHNLRVCLYIAYIACGSALLNIKTLYFFICNFFMLEAATIANIKIRYDAKTPQFAIFGTRVICVFYSIS